MEARKGKGNMEKMVRKWKEEEENKKWMKSRTRACAGCGVRVEKRYVDCPALILVSYRLLPTVHTHLSAYIDRPRSHGCNHMTCNRCSSHFCYRCGESISPQDPYAHYRRPGHACFERLFDQEEIERFERETAMGVAGIPPEGVDIEGEWRDIRGFWEW
jgi:E3 ubiquitin-protein ligase RNF14